MKTSGTMNSATGHTSVSTRTGNFSDGLYDKAGARPDLDLDFARTKSLKDRVSKEDLITFTRGASRIRGTTYVDENGLVKRASHNLLLYSHDIGNPSGWLKIEGSAHGSFCTVTRNTTETTAPNGMFEATKLVMDSGTTSGRVTGVHTGEYTGTQLQVDDFIIYSVYLKSATNANQPINLSVSGTSRGVFTVTPEWQRFAIRAQRDAVADFRPRVVIRNTGSNGSNPPQSDGSYVSQHAEIYAWGAQMEFDGTAGSDLNNYTGPIGELVKTTTQPSGAPRFTHDPYTLESKGLLIEQAATNLQVNSQSLGSWTHHSSASGSYDNSIQAPDGTYGSVYVKDNGAEIYQPWGTIPSGTNQVTISYFAKRNPNVSGNFVTFEGFRYSNALGNLGFVSEFDIVNKTFHTHLDNTDSSLANPSNEYDRVSRRVISNEHFEEYPNGWIRVFATITLAASEGNFLSNSARLDVQGSVHYIWGVQVEVGDVGTSYIPTTTATASRSPDIASIEGDNFGTYRKNVVSNTSFRKASDGYLITGVNANATYESYAGISPSGNYDALKITADSTTGFHRILQYVTLDNSSVYSVSSYLKAGGTDKCVVSLWDGDSTVGMIRVDLTAETTQIIGGVTSTNVSLTDVGNSWYLLKFTSISTTVSGNPAVIVNVCDSSFATNFAGNGESLFVWGLQVEKASAATEFIPSTDAYTNRQSNATFVDGNGIVRTSYVNLLKYSDMLAHSTWARGSATFTVDNVLAPDGTMTADTWGADSTRYAFYNSTAGSFMSDHNQILYPFTITDEWVRYSISVTTASGQTGIRVYPLRTNNNLDYIYQSVTVEENTTYVFSAWYKKVGTKVYVWGCQFVKGSEAGEYARTAGAIAAPPRYSHDPETLTPTGLYLEPAATTLIPYSEDFTQSTWVKDFSTVTANATTAPDGTNTATLVTVDSSTNAHRLREVNNTIGPHQYTFSLFVKANTTSHIALSIYKGGATSATILYVRYKLDTEFVSDDPTLGTGTITKYPNGWYRLTGTSIPDSNTEHATFAINILRDEDHPLTYAGNGQSAYIWGAQLEQNVVDTSYIPTSGATATRAADTFTSTATEVLDRANGTKSAFFTKDGISIFVGFRLNNQRIAPTDTNANNNTHIYNPVINLRQSSTAVLQLFPDNYAHWTTPKEPRLVSFTPSPIDIFLAGNYTEDEDVKSAIRFQENNSQLSVNTLLYNGIGGRDSSVTIGSPTILHIGHSGGNLKLNGTINRVTFWKTPLPDIKLQKFTS